MHAMTAATFCSPFFFVFLSSVDDSCPDSTIATSDVTAEGTMGTSNVTGSVMVSADVSGVCEKGDSPVVPEADAKLSLRMNLVTPLNYGSEESLPFSLESKRMKHAGLARSQP